MRTYRVTLVHIHKGLERVTLLKMTLKEDGDGQERKPARVTMHKATANVLRKDVAERQAYIQLLREEAEASITGIIEDFRTLEERVREWTFIFKARGYVY